MVTRMIFWLLIFSGCIDAFGQVDSTYIRSYENDFMARIFLARRYTNFNFRNDPNDLSIQYSPNSGFALGAGANYKWATVNISYAFDFLNPYKSRGDTRALDFQLHGYGQKIVIDLLGQYYTGFYLPAKQIRSQRGGYYVRPDIRVTALGGTLQYVFNNKRFSYRAAFIQNQLQRRSAGTFLAGMEIYSGRIAGDSSLVPSVLVAEPVHVRSMDFIEIGPNVAYAYTWVYKEKMFLSGTVSVSLNAGYNRYRETSSKLSSVTISPNSLFRVSGGYSTRWWSFTLLYVTTGLYLPGEDDNHVIVNSGDLRFNVNHRFKPTRMMARYLKPVDKAADEIDSILGGDKK
jgi:hypothetical protein